MAATGKTPILLYGSTTPTNAPTAGNLTNSSDGCEIAINVADKNLFFKDSTNAVNTVPIRQSSGSSDGWLSSANWTTFNSKQAAYTNLTSIGSLANATGWLYNNGSGTFSYSTPSASDVGAVPTSRTVSTTSPLAGGGALSSNLTLSITQATTSTSGYLSSTDWNTFNNKQPAGTYVTSVTGTAPVVSSGGTTPAISMAAANGSTNGYLTSTDWTTFNGKAPSFTYTTGYVPFGQGTTTPTQDSALFWDNTNKRLGLGTTTPTSRLHLSGAASTATFQTTSAGTVASPVWFGNLFTAYDNSARAAVYCGDASVDGYGAFLKFAVNNPSNVLTDVGKFDYNYNFTLTSGNLVIGTSGKGIDFSATPGTGTSELLADYEEGTWTPTISSSSGSVSSYTSSGTYQKIGSFVSIQFYIVVSNVGTASGGFYVSLPYTSAVRACGAIRENANTGYMFQAWIAAAGATTFSINRYDNVNGWNPGNGMTYYGCLTYQV